MDVCADMCRRACRHVRGRVCRQVEPEAQSHERPVAVHLHTRACARACLVQDHEGRRQQHRVPGEKEVAAAYIVMAYVVMAYVVMAYILMAFIVMARRKGGRRSLYSYGPI